MAYDLLLGNTTRDWSCGIALYSTPAKRGERVLAAIEVRDLGKLVETEIQQNFREIVRLQTAKKMPVDLRRSFKPLLSRWQDFSRPKNGKFVEADYLELVNFRDENRLFTQKLAALTPAATSIPAATSAPTTPPPALKTAALAIGGAASLALLIHAIRK